MTELECDEGFSFHVSIVMLQHKNKLLLPRTTSLAEAKALSTTVWAVQVYNPA